MRHLLLSVPLVLAGVAPVSAGDPEVGKALYRQHCAACHGVDAQGTGPVAAVLMVTPVDLTALAAKNDGVFPTERVVMRIDGRDPLVSHGSDMPIYGDFFAGTDGALKSASGQPILTSVAIVDLVTYLETLQK